MNQSDIVEMYKFVRGDQSWLYTSADEPQTHDGDAFTPESISRGSDEQGQEINRAGLTVVVPRANAVAAEFVGFAPEQLMMLTVFRRIGEVTAVIWQGRVIGCRRHDNEAELDCEPIFTSLRRAGLTQRYHANCRHFLFDAGCRVNPESYKAEATVTGANGLNVEVSGLGAYQDGYFQAGHVVSPTTGATRMILAHAGGTLTLTAAIQGLAVNDVLEVYAGCPHTLVACHEKFDNVINFGGMPFIPELNPFGRSIL